MTRSTNMEYVEVLREGWKVVSDGHEIAHSDFGADVVLTLSGDFATNQERAQFAQALADRLNAAPAEAQPVAWMRRCAFDRVDVMTLAKPDRPRGWNMHAVTENKALPDDVPLYAAPPSAPVGVGSAPAAAPSESQSLRNAEILRDAANEIVRTGRVSRRAGYAEYLVMILTDAADCIETLTQQPAAVDGDNPYPAPRNRQEAASPAKLALAYLGVTSAHIDAAVARCETDLAAQPGGSDNDR